MRSRSLVASALDDDTYTVVDRALGRMRLLAAAVWIFQSFMARQSSVDDVLGPLLLQVAGAALMVGAAHLLARAAARRRGTLAGRGLAACGHVLDVLVAVQVVAYAHVDDGTWALLVVPVLAGALRYGLRGALLTWLGVAVLHLGQVVAGADSDDLTFLADLGQQVTQLAVVLLVALPAGYLSEHLMIEVKGLSRVYTAAEQRSGLLQVVAVSSQQVTDLDGQVFDAALEAAHRLGFAAGDLWEGTDGPDGWSRLAASPAGAIPVGLVAHLGSAALDQGPLVVDRATGNRDELASLQAGGLEAVVLVPVAGRRTATVLRAVLPAGKALHPSQVECLELLARQAGVALRNGELVADLHTAGVELEHQAFHDHLTGIANRALFTRRLEEVTADAAASGRTLAVLFCDLDRFKAVNDGLGHAVGNDLLVAATGRLRSCLREDALLARMGGDEFTLLLPDLADPREAEEVATRVCAALTAPFALGGHEVVISTSVGIAVSDPTCLDPGELVRRGDVAMYRSKARGRGCWTVWGQELEVATLSRLQLERDLRRAVDFDEIDVLFQPVVRADGTVAGVESLARWHHDDRGMVSPDEFIPIAEQSELIVDLGRQVARRALSEARPWLEAVGPSCFLALNVSPREVTSVGFADELDALVRSSGLTSSRILLEITERIVASGADAAAALHDLAARGYLLALDDFGHGQTSLQHLRHLPITALKIDRGFVAEADADDRVRIIIGAVVGLGRDLGLDVIAEGVETDRQADALRAMGCTHLQGYGIGVPVEATALPAAALPMAAVGAPLPQPTTTAVGSVPTSATSAAVSVSVPVPRAGDDLASAPDGDEAPTPPVALA